MTPHILVPIDFSDASVRALEWAGRLAQATSGKVLVLHVVPISPAAAGMPAPWVEPDLADIEATRARLETLVRGHEIPEAAIRVAVLEDVGMGVVETARQAGCDLVVMTTHGRGGWKRAVLGSVADYVSRHADCPVVTMRGYDEAG